MKLPMLCSDCSRTWTQQEFSNACVESLYPLICEQCMRHQGTVDGACIVEDASIIIPTDNDVDTYSDKVEEKQEIVTLTEYTTSDKTVKFGEAIRDKFLLHDGSTFLNHGSYGAVPRRVHEYKTRWVLALIVQLQLGNESVISQGQANFVVTHVIIQ